MREQLASLRRDPSSLLTRVALVAVGVLGWLGAQRLTFGFAEHSHLGHEQPVHHHHDYAAPLAFVAAAAVLAALVALLVVRAGQPPARPEVLERSHPARLAYLPGTVAPLLFVTVETLELHLAGRGHDSSTMALLLVGAALQAVAVPLAYVVAGLALHLIADAAGWPGVVADLPAARMRRARPHARVPTGGAPLRAQHGRAPPGRGRHPHPLPLSLSATAALAR